jgi:2-aminoadipate transaminase
MTIQFSDRSGEIKASEIRELLKLTENPEVISFAGGLPASELFPKEEIARISKKVFEEEGNISLQYGSTDGYIPLRKLIAEQLMSQADVNVNEDNIMITNGSQQGLEFSAKLFVNEGDVILCESPSYLGAINAFKVYRPKFIEIPTDDDGMIIEELEKALKTNDRVKMIYTIPDFQNPSGKTLPVSRRKDIARLASVYQVPVIEDSPYGDLIFEGKRLPSIMSFDKDGYVIYLGTFSKIFCPGFRLGWVCADPEITRKYILIKQGADLQSSTVSQLITYRFFEVNDINKHIEKIIAVYRKRRDVMLKSIETYFPKEVKCTSPKGGLFAWAELREDLNARDIFKEAIEQNVAFVPGGSFFPNGGHENYFRLNYSAMPEDRIEEGIKRLGSVLKRHY